MSSHAKKDHPTAVYRFYGADGKLLYVGASMNLEGRFRHHRYSTEWWQQCTRAEFTWYPNRAEALAAEALAIETESPEWNATGSRADLHHPERNMCWCPGCREVRARAVPGVFVKEKT